MTEPSMPVPGQPRRWTPAPLQAGVVFAAVLASNLWLLGWPHLARTEAHRAITAHQLLREGNWLIPKLFGQPYLRKPPLHYWVLAASEQILGENPWAWRLPSALAAALLAAMVTLMSRRWFGREAGWPGGLAFLSLLLLWEQNRSADIDALNTAAAAACALALLELTCGSTRRSWAWSLLAGLTLGATLLLKGPAGLPVILGAAIGPAIVNKNWRGLLRPAIVVVAILGVAIFAAWVLAALASAKHAGISPDVSGPEEIGKRLLDASKIPYALLLPLALLALSCPVSLSVWFATRPEVLHRAGDAERRLIRGLAAAVIASLLIGVVFMLDRVRYGAITLPLLCPLAGATGAFWIRGWYGQPTRAFLRGILTATAVGVSAVAILAGIKAGVHTPLGRLVPLAAAAAASVGLWTLFCLALRRLSRAAWGLVALLMLTAVPFDAWRSRLVESRSAYVPAQKLRRVVGSQSLVAARALSDRPELFYYAGYSGADLRYIVGPSFLGMNFPPGTVLALNEQEFSVWKKRSPGGWEVLSPIRNRDMNLTVLRITAPTTMPATAPATAPAAP